MKFHLFACALFVGLTGCATVEQGPPLSIVSIHESPGKTKQQICSEARDWVALTFKDSKSVIEVFEPENGKLIGKGSFGIVTMVEVMPTQFTMIVECKNDRLRATYNNVTPYSKGQPFPLISSPILGDPRGQAEIHLKKLDADLSAYLKGSKVGDNW